MKVYFWFWKSFRAERRPNLKKYVSHPCMSSKHTPFKWADQGLCIVNRIYAGIGGPFSCFCLKINDAKKIALPLFCDIWCGVFWGQNRFAWMEMRNCSVDHQQRLPY